MSNELKAKPVVINHAEFTKFFGTPPVLSSESLEVYHAMTDEFLECVRPGDFVELMFVKDLAVFEWEVLRYMRHKTLVIERRFRKRLEYQASRNKLAKSDRAKTSEPATNQDRIDQLEDAVDATIEDVDEIFKRAANEFNHAQGLEDGIEYFERLDKLLNEAIARRNDCLEQITRYRADLGQHLRRASEAIIDAEFKAVAEVETAIEAPLVP